MTTTTLSIHIRAPRALVYRALLDAADVQHWMVPDDMMSEVHTFDPVVGGAFRISLTYDTPSRTGKTSSNTDTHHGWFTRLEENALVEQAVEFETDDPGMQGRMTITYELVDVADGTELRATHRDLPRALSPSDNALGWRMSLGKLAALVEKRAALGGGR